MRLHLLIALILVSGGALAGGAPQPQIVDPPRDIEVGLTHQGLPDPVIDVRSVLFTANSDDLFIKIVVEDLEWEAPILPANGRSITVSFHDDDYILVLAAAIQHDVNEWIGVVGCSDPEYQTTCTYDIGILPIDHAENSITMAVPRWLFAGSIDSPKAAGRANYAGWQFTDSGILDNAPNCELTYCHGGADFTPP